MFSPRLAWFAIHLPMALHSWDHKHASPHLVDLLRWDFTNFLSILPISASQEAGIAGMSYLAWTSKIPFSWRVKPLTAWVL
jgi:hypothetical protein